MVDPITMTTAPTYTLLTVTLATSPLTETGLLAARKGVMFRNASVVDIALCNAAGTAYITLEPSDSMAFLIDYSTPVIFYFKTASAAAATVERMEWK